MSELRVGRRTDGRSKPWAGPAVRVSATPSLAVRDADGSATGAVRDAYERMAQVDRPDIWIFLRPEHEVHAEAADVDVRRAAGAELPLAGVLIAVKDNIDVLGLQTTAGCAAFAYQAEHSAPAVYRLQAAGAIVLGKTNLDQFATGLVGTRSPYGAVRHAWLPDRVSGGSSSGSAVAVALGIVDIGVGTDTAGSGRVPAALHGIVGLKPTLGLIPTRGVVPAARSYDCVSVFTRSMGLAELAVGLMSGEDGTPGPAVSPEAPLAAPPVPVVAVPLPGQLVGMSASWLTAFEQVVAGLASRGMEVVQVDITPFLEAAEMLYGSALVAERYAAFGEFAEKHPEALDPSVLTIVTSGRDIPAHELLNARHRVELLRQEAMDRLAHADVLLLPTVPEHPSLSEVAAAPLATNARLGRFTSFTNLFGMPAAAVPAGHVDNGPFGVTVFGRPYADRVVADVARRLIGEEPGPASEESSGPLLFVVGAHLRGQPLHAELTTAGARFLGPGSTAPRYRLLDLETSPAKPGLEHIGPGGSTIAGELYRLPAAALGRLLSALPAPMVLGPVSLDDERQVTGFLCHLPPGQERRDISGWGGWRAYLAACGQGRVDVDEAP